MSRFDDQYIDLCRRILAHGEKVQNYKKTDTRSNNTATAIPDHAAQGNQGTKTIRLPHQMLQFDLSEEFPILTSKKVAFKSAILEILWIYQVQSNDVKWLHDRKVHIWDEWEIPEDGMYMGRDFNELYKKHGLSENPVGTIGTAYGWIVNRYQLVQNLIDGKLNLLVTSRSTDVPLGLPFNIVQYATLCYLIAHCLGVKPGQFTFVTNDAHIYENQVEGIKEQIKRYEDANEGKDLPKAPKLWINPDVKDFFKLDNSRELKDIKLEDYKHLGAIKMPITEQK